MKPDADLETKRSLETNSCLATKCWNFETRQNNMKLNAASTVALKTYIAWKLDANRTDLKPGT